MNRFGKVQPHNQPSELLHTQKPREHIVYEVVNKLTVDGREVFKLECTSIYSGYTTFCYEEHFTEDKEAAQLFINAKEAREAVKLLEAQLADAQELAKITERELP
jgi:hypothetical protein